MQLYAEILDAGGPAFAAILRHVRDSPNEAFIFHCTGVFPALQNLLPLKKLFSWERPDRDRSRSASSRESCFALVTLLLSQFPPARRHSL